MGYWARVFYLAQRQLIQGQVIMANFTFVKVRADPIRQNIGPNWASPRAKAILIALVEIAALEANGTWDLVSLPSDITPIGSN